FTSAARCCDLFEGRLRAPFALAGVCMGYAVKEIFKTLQGEGAQAGRPAVFCRFAGCNLACSFCDTAFTGGEAHGSAPALADAIEQAWQGTPDHRFVVLTGGEPPMEVDAPAVDRVRARRVAT